MKEKILSRLDRLEDVIRQKHKVPLVAIKNEDGTIDWNGVYYANDADLIRDARSILGDNWELPIVIINQQKDLTKNENQSG